MPVSRLFPAVLVLGLLAAPAFAASPPSNLCLSKAEQRTAVAEQKAIPLGRAIKTRREHGHHAELVRARLCHHGDGLVYVLTLLERSGRVTSETVDAVNGEVINGR
jgi:uncharacterized membrane protein YkoI